MKMNLLTFCLISSFLALSGCAEETTDSSFPLTYSSQVQALLSNGKATTARVFYTYQGLGTDRRVQPAVAVPKHVLITGANGEEERRYLWQTASNSGFSIVDGQIDLTGLPLGKKATNIGIELLQDVNGDGNLYVVAYYCYVGPTTEGLSAAQIKVEKTVNHEMQVGRTCGNCDQTPENPADKTQNCASDGGTAQ